MGWNYRVVKRTNDDEVCYYIHEAYYSRKGDKVPNSITKDPVYVMSEDVKDLPRVLDMMRVALDKPVLNYEDF